MVHEWSGYCNYCGIAYKKKVTNQKYCCTTCYSLSKKGVTLSEVRFSECQHCGTPFVARGWQVHKKFCTKGNCSGISHSAVHNKGRRSRVPSWLTDEHKRQIREVYALAKKRTMSTKVLHHVDHIVPLKGKNISGLHVPWNLQVITAEENLRKGNNFG